MQVRQHCQPFELQLVGAPLRLKHHQHLEKQDSGAKGRPRKVEAIIKTLADFSSANWFSLSKLT